MARLDTADTKKLRKTQFAYVDSKGGVHLPLNDESHIRSAMARCPSSTCSRSMGRPGGSATGDPVP